MTPLRQNYGMSEETTDVGTAIAGELQLMDPDVRASRSLA
ncbi:hypothetical protein SMICM304S_00794 [Streptomyces microflavus]